MPLIPNGTTFDKQFDVGVFQGTVDFYDPDLSRYRIVYADGDLEDITASELRRLISLTPKDPARTTTKSATSARGRPKETSKSIPPNTQVAPEPHLQRNPSAQPRLKMSEMAAVAPAWSLTSSAQKHTLDKAPRKRSSESQESSVESTEPAPSRPRTGCVIQRLQQLAQMDRFPQLQVKGPGGGYRTATVEEQSADGIVVEYADGQLEMINLRQTSEYDRIKACKALKRKKAGQLLAETVWPGLEEAMKASMGNEEAMKASMGKDGVVAAPAAATKQSKPPPKPACTKMAPAPAKRKPAERSHGVWPGMRKAMKMSMIAAGLPASWPPSIEYISRNIHDTQLHSLTKLDTPGSHIEGVEIRQLDKTHVAFDEAAGSTFGLFALEPISVGAVLGDYAGLVKRRVAGDCSRYLFQLTRGEGAVQLDIDALEVGNEMRMINDFHGVAKMPNCKYDVYDNRESNCRAARVVCIQSIQVDDELLCDYGQFLRGSQQQAVQLQEGLFYCQPDDTPLSVAISLGLDVKALVALNAPKFKNDLRQNSKFEKGALIHLPGPRGVELSDEQMQLRWGLQIGQGDRVDCKDVNGNWASALVTSSNRQKVVIHFTGYHTEFDETITREELPVKLRPRGTMCEGSGQLIMTDGDEMKPERILNIRVVDKDVEEYLVQWQGYSEDDCTWERLHNLRDNRGNVYPSVICFLKEPTVQSP